MKTRFYLKFILVFGLIISMSACEIGDEIEKEEDPPIHIEKGTVTDIDGNNYTTVKIGDQWWMAENLRVTHYSNGGTIPLVTDDAEWGELSNSSTEDKVAYCYYDNDVNNAATYGVLYTWVAAMNEAGSSEDNPSGIQGVSPDGWHLPSDAEWTELENYLIANGYNYDGTTIGNKIAKSLASTSGWENLTPYIGAVGKDQSDNNNTGFTAYPSGYRSSYGSYNYAGGTGYWWSASANGGGNAWYRYINYAAEGVGRAYYVETVGLSVRCVKD